MYDKHKHAKQMIGAFTHMVEFLHEHALVDDRNV